MQEVLKKAILTVSFPKEESLGIYSTCLRLYNSFEVTGEEEGHIIHNCCI